MPTVLISGANQGLGLEFARQYAADGWQVIASCRRPDSADDLQRLAKHHHSVTIEQLDVTSLAGIDDLAHRYAGQTIDLLLNNAGMIGPHPVAEHIRLQHFGTLDYGLWDEVIRTNTFGPVKMAEAFLANVADSDQKKIVTLSSTVGSITERDTPAMAYATSKTAVNKAMKILAAQLKDQEIIVALLCPGQVKTRMDFGNSDVDIDVSVVAMRGLIERMTLASSGTFTRYSGETIAW